MYSHTQIGWVIIICFAIPVLIILTIQFDPIILSVVLAPLLLFYRLRITEYDNFLLISFGIGLIRKKIIFADITSVSIAKNHWWEGFGIRKVSGGWLFNVSGLDAVKLTMKNGKIYRIGADEPEKLFVVIRNRLIADK